MKEPELHPRGRLILSTLTVAAFAAAGLYTCANGPKEYRKPAEERKAPELGILIIGPSIEGKVHAVGIEVPEQTRQGLMQYVPLWYEIDGLKNRRTDVPIERGKYAAFTYFTQPTSIDGMILKLYGTHPETKKPVLLQAQKLPHVPNEKRTYY
jgi:hypothetical protein